MSNQPFTSAEFPRENDTTAGSLSENASSTIITPEDNQIFARQMTRRSDDVQFLDFDTETLFDSDDARAFGPDRQLLINDSTTRVKATEHLRFADVSSPTEGATRPAGNGTDQAVYPSGPKEPAGDRAPAENRPASGERSPNGERPSNGERTPAAERTEPSQEYLVKPGDSLWKIAREQLGTTDAKEITAYIKEIVRLNGWKDSSHPIFPGDRIKVPVDRNAEVKPDNQVKDEQRQKLEQLAEKRFGNDPERLAEFKENMRRFEERAKKDGLSDAEVAKAYRETARLLEAEGNKPLSPEQRNRLAEQVMRQSADPTTIDQGNHNTCNMSTVEARMYTKNPSDAIRLVADVALTGQYTTKDGIRVRVNPLPHGSSKDSSTIDGDRSHAGEIFQVTTANIHIEMENRKTNPRGQLRYEQHPERDGSGASHERVIDYSKKPPVLVDDHPQIYGHNAGNLRDVYRSITGIDEKGIVVAHENVASDRSDGVKRIKTEQELNDYLAESKRNGKLPLIVAVDTNNEPFWSDSDAGSAGGSGGKHVVTITDYDPGPPPKVTIDNQWGKGNDHDATRPVSVRELYLAMQQPGDAAQQLKNEADEARRNGQPDLKKEMEVARLQFLSRQIDEKDYEKELKRLSAEVKDLPEGEERNQLKKRLSEGINQLPPGGQFRVVREQFDIGLLDQEDFVNKLKKLTDNMVRKDENIRREGSSLLKRGWGPIYEEGVKELINATQGLPADKIKEIRDSLPRRRPGAATVPSGSGSGGAGGGSGSGSGESRTNAEPRG